MYKEKNILLNEEKIKQKSNKRNYIYLKLKAKIKNINTKKKKIKSYKTNKNSKNSTFFSNKYIIIIFIILGFISLYSIWKFFYFKYLLPKRHNIPIAFSLNDKYVYPLIVSLTSILYNASPNTFINLIYMGDKFSNYQTSYYRSSAVYYRLELSNLITGVDKIIYLDVDTMTHKDLTELYNIDMGNYYYMGFPGHDLVFTIFNGTRNFINTGTILINLKKLREVNAPILFQDYYNKYGTQKVDEYLINAVFYNKIKFLPLIYGIPDFGGGAKKTSSPSHFVEAFKNLTNFTKEEMESAHENRAITHGCYDVTKWWQRKYHSLTDVGKQWLFYASKSNIFDDICKEYKQFEKYCEKIKNGKQYNIKDLNSF